MTRATCSSLAVGLLIVLLLGGPAWAGVFAHRIETPAVLANPVASAIPIDGYTPLVVMGMTNATQNLNTYDTMQQPTLVGTPLGGPYYSTVLFDTGANANLLSYADRTAFGLSGIGHDFVVEGAGTGSITADIMQASGYFANGLQALYGSGGGVDTSGFRGVSNVQALAGRSSSVADDLPSVVGMPLAAFYTTVIRTDRLYAASYYGAEVVSPTVEFYTSRYDPGVPTNLDYRLQTSFYQAEALPPVFIEPIEIWGIPVLPATPTVSAALLIEGVSLSHTVSQPRVTGGDFLFDTGAQVTVLSVDRALDLGLNLASPEFTVEISGVGGSIQEAPGFTVDTLTLPATGLGDMVLHDVPIIVLNVPNDSQPLDGIIGMNLFTDRDLVIHAGYGGGMTWGSPFIGVTAAHAMGLAGDADGSRLVDDRDLSVLLSHWGAAGGVAWSEGDFNRDGRIDDRDLSVLLGHWGDTAAAVPEPATLALLAGGLAVLGRRGKRSRA